MTKRKKILLTIAAALAALVVVLVIASILVAAYRLVRELCAREDHRHDGRIHRRCGRDWLVPVRMDTLDGSDSQLCFARHGT